MLPETTVLALSGYYALTKMGWKLLLHGGKDGSCYGQTDFDYMRRGAGFRWRTQKPAFDGHQKDETHMLLHSRMATNLCHPLSYYYSTENVRIRKAVRLADDMDSGENSRHYEWCPC
ncbi:hypothetical protein T265_03451 [Opisthorchis viverrini]|uniref:Uncharacterized protein n=1 Tax=Opisthorchis viverrini TaxID=6198 RepID=A0A074ZW24_OPIVI|nr:hypothetical protein T265_03451 [Opisthorchis viverrini]KER30087.1 hypothetical protein T265_03451 [Opisthorchis viverrini]